MSFHVLAKSVKGSLSRQVIEDIFWLPRRRLFMAKLAYISHPNLHPWCLSVVADCENAATFYCCVRDSKPGVSPSVMRN